MAGAGLVVALAEEDVLAEPVHEEGVEAEGAGNPGETVLLGENACRGEVEVVDAPEHETDDDALHNEDQRRHDPHKHEAHDTVPAGLVELVEVVGLVEAVAVAVALAAVEEVAVAEVLLRLLAAGLVGPGTLVALELFGLLLLHLLPRADDEFVGVVVETRLLCGGRSRCRRRRSRRLFAVAVVQRGLLSGSSSTWLCHTCRVLLLGHVFSAGSFHLSRGALRKEGYFSLSLPCYRPDVHRWPLPVGGQQARTVRPPRA